MMLEIKWWFIHKYRELIVYPYQRVTKGYDNRINWGYDSWFINILPELRKFCVDSTDYLPQELNKSKLKKLSRTIVLIDKYNESNDDHDLVRLSTHFGKNILIYWD